MSGPRVAFCCSCGGEVVRSKWANAARCDHQRWSRYCIQPDKRPPHVRASLAAVRLSGVRRWSRASARWGAGKVSCTQHGYEPPRHTHNSHSAASAGFASGGIRASVAVQHAAAAEEAVRLPQRRPGRTSLLIVDQTWAITNAYMQDPHCGWSSGFCVTWKSRWHPSIGPSICA